MTTPAEGTPTDQALLQLAELPPDYSQCWYADVVTLDSGDTLSVVGGDYPPLEHIAVCTTAEGWHAHTSRQRASADKLDASFLLLWTAATLARSQHGGYRPGTLKVFCNDVVEPLGDMLAPLGVIVERARNVPPTSVTIAFGRAVTSAVVASAKTA